jgi:hypothetical protein
MRRLGRRLDRHQLSGAVISARTAIGSLQTITAKLMVIKASRRPLPSLRRCADTHRLQRLPFLSG